VFGSLEKTAAMNLGWTLSIAIPVALLLVFTDRSLRTGAVTRAAVAFLVQGVVCVIVLRARAATHGFYWLPLAPGVALLFMQAARVVSSRLDPRLGPVATGAVVAVLLGVPLATGFRETEDTRRILERPGLLERAQLIDSFVNPEDFLCAPQPEVLAAVLHSKRGWIPPLVQTNLLEEVLTVRDETKLFRKLVFLTSEPVMRAFPDLRTWLEAKRERGAPCLRLPNGWVVYVL
jgi:hypothetical protein